MPELVTDLLNTEGLVWLVAAFSVAGLIRGFTGFGTAMIVVPIGATFLPMPHIIFILTISGFGTAITLVPKAWNKANKREVLNIGLAAIVAMPLGVFLLTLLAQDTLRWGLSIVIAGVLAALLGGWRYHGALGPFQITGIGASAGVIGGATGLTGPIVILFYLAGKQATATVRANAILFLALMDVAIAANLVIRDLVQWDLLVLAIVVTIPYMAVSMVGQALFQPRYEGFYRIAAYSIIVLAALTSLPIFD